MLGFELISALTLSRMCVQKLQGVEDVRGAMSDYLSTAPPGTKEKLLVELRGLAAAIPGSEFFRSHEFVGSSLLFVYDSESSFATVKMIDFGKTSQYRGLTHVDKWVPGNHEDEYLIGVTNLIRVLQQC